MKKLLKKETKKLIHAFTHPTFIYLTIVGNGLLFTAITVVYFLERDVNPNMKTYFDYMLWGVSTTTTIDYGDILPVTIAGRIVAMMLMYTGAVLFVTFTGVILTVLMKGEVSRELNPLEKEFKINEKEQMQTLHVLADVMNRLEKIEKKIH